MDFLTEFFHRLTDIKELVRWAGYPGLAAMIFSETGLLVGFFLPGDSLLVTAGIFAAAGYFEVVPLCLLLNVAAVAGNATGYWIGKKGGQALYNRPESRFFKREHLLKTKQFYEKYGAMTIVLAQFMPFARTFAPVVAGIAEMRYVRFASYNVIGAICWIWSMILIGFFLGNSIPDIDKHIVLVVAVVVFISLLPGIVKYVQVKIAARKSV